MKSFKNISKNQRTFIVRLKDLTDYLHMIKVYHTKYPKSERAMDEEKSLQVSIKVRAR